MCIFKRGTSRFFILPEYFACKSEAPSKTAGRCANRQGARCTVRRAVCAGQAENMAYIAGGSLRWGGEKTAQDIEPKKIRAYKEEKTLSFVY